MNRSIRTAALAAAVAATTLIPALDAAAGDRYYRDDHYRGHRHHHHRQVIVRKDNTGELLAAGIIGLALGAIIVGAANAPEPLPQRPPRPRPHRDYYPPAPAPIYDGYGYEDTDEPEVIYADRAYRSSYEPWTPGWFNYCRNRFRSFDSRTGTYMGFDGQRHFCVVR